jgi:hypothetical protein
MCVSFCPIEILLHTADMVNPKKWRELVSCDPPSAQVRIHTAAAEHPAAHARLGKRRVIEGHRLRLPGAVFALILLDYLVDAPNGRQKLQTASARLSCPSEWRGSR